MRYSLIVPVYNRPQEVDELLGSLVDQEFSDFEVVIVEDGSSESSEGVVQRYAERLSVQYFTKPNSGPGLSRNYGAERAKGEYLIVLDSDCLIPPQYLKEVEAELQRQPVDCFGGPDAAHDSFSNLQKAINYSMTSFLTTGGIRGGKNSMESFRPRSFNMGFTREVLKTTGGFSSMRFGEDIDFTLRIVEAGFQTRLFPAAFVYHKRRTDFKKFFKQVHNSGIARINLHKRHPGSMKAVHMLPALFTLGAAACLLGGLLISSWLVWPLLIFSGLILLDATFRSKSLIVGMLALPASFIQLTGYGTGFLLAFWKRIIMKRGEFNAFLKNYYK